MAARSIWISATGGLNKDGRSDTVVIWVYDDQDNPANLDPRAITLAETNRLIPQYNSYFGVDHQGFVYPDHVVVSDLTAICHDIRWSDIKTAKVVNRTDLDLTQAIAMGPAATDKGLDTICYREFTCTFGPKEKQKQQNQDGQKPPAGKDPTSDPLTWGYWVKERPIARQQVAEELKFLGGFSLNANDVTNKHSDGTKCGGLAGDQGITLESVINSGTCYMVKGRVIPITNTVGQRFQNPPTVTRRDKEIIMTVTSDFAVDSDSFACFENLLNSIACRMEERKVSLWFPGVAFELNDVVQVGSEFFKCTTAGISAGNSSDLAGDPGSDTGCEWEGTAAANVPILWQRNFAVHELWFQNMEQERREYNFTDAKGVRQSRDYWERRFIFHYRKGGWFIDILNTGTLRKANAGDPNGFGGSLSVNDIQPGNALVQPITNQSGYAINRPVRLSKTGQPETTDSNYYLRWLPDGDVDLTTMGVSWLRA